MSIKEAASHLFNDNKEFQEVILGYGKEALKLKTYRARFKRGDLGELAIIRLLLRFEYQIDVKLKSKK